MSHQKNITMSEVCAKSLVTHPCFAMIVSHQFSHHYHEEIHIFVSLVDFVQYDVGERVNAFLFDETLKQHTCCTIEKLGVIGGDAILSNLKYMRNKNCVHLFSSNISIYFYNIIIYIKKNLSSKGQNLLRGWG